MHRCESIYLFGELTGLKLKISMHAHTELCSGKNSQLGTAAQVSFK